MNGNRATRTQSTKPVNINISFTINPKNIVNQQSFGVENQMKNKKIVGAIQPQSIQKQFTTSKPKTPQLVNTERVEANKEYLFKNQDRKEKKSRKRNSVDQTYLNDYNKRFEAEKSINLNKDAESLHIRKSSTKSKKQSETSTKRKHNKTISKVSALQNFTMKASASGNNGLLEQRNRNLKNLINRLMTNQLSKKSLPLELPAQQNKTARKKKASNKKELKEGRSQYLIRRQQKQEDIDAINRKMIIEKLSSLRSMNNSIFRSQQDQQVRPRQRRTIVINTDHSIDCIDQIHQMEKALTGRKSSSFKGNGYEKERNNANETQDLIANYLKHFNEQVQYEGQLIQDDQNPIESQFEAFRRSHSPERQNQVVHFDRQPYMKEKIQKFSPNFKQKQKQVESKQKKSNYEQKQKNCLRPACSSEMTKEQKMINQIERVKLNQLKKHQVEKWGELLTFIKQSLNEGKTNHDQILIKIYHFLEKTKMDLQKQASKDSEHSKDQLQDFTNKFDSNQLVSNKKQEEAPEQENSFNQISSMSYKDEDYEQENQQLKLMNLQMIQNALKSRHEGLIEKRNREIATLEQQKISGKISENQFQSEKQKIEKWTKKQTGEIMQARKNIWKGYNQAKGIIQKSLKSKHFQQQSAKKKNMMKCLSENYLLKNYNYKKLLKPQQQESQNQDGSEKSSEKQQPESDKEPWEQSQSKVSSQQEKQEQGLQHSLNSSSKHSDVSEQKNVSNQFQRLSEEDDMNVIKEKLLDLKHKHLKEDEPTSPEGKLSQDISYQQVDNELQDSISDAEMKLISKELGKEGKLPPPQIDEYEKLRHMLPEDKEDVFEFIFLDLSIQIYQEPCHNNKLMNAVTNYIAHMKRQANKKRGIKTNLNIVKEYLKRFLGFILRGHKNILKTLDQPVGPTALQMLRYMHENDDDPAECEQNPSPLVIPTSVFDLFERSLMPSIQFEVYYENDEEKENKRVEFLKNIMHIHNKALFDAMNEYLDLLRPYGVWGKPFPWKNSSTFLHAISEEQKQQKLKKSSEKVIEYCSYVCGLLVDKQESLVGNARLSQDYIEQIKQDRLSRMLATELMQNEQRWLFYDDEETEVLVQISNAIYLIMLREATHEAYEIMHRNKNQPGA